MRNRNHKGVIALRFLGGLIVAAVLGAFPGLLVGGVIAGFTSPIGGAPVEWTIGVAICAALGARVAWLGVTDSLGNNLALWLAGTVAAS